MYVLRYVCTWLLCGTKTIVIPTITALCTLTPTHQWHAVTRHHHCCCACTGCVWVCHGCRVCVVGGILYQAANMAETEVCFLCFLVWSFFWGGSFFVLFFLVIFCVCFCVFWCFFSCASLVLHSFCTTYLPVYHTPIPHTPTCFSHLNNTHSNYTPHPTPPPPPHPRTVLMLQVVQVMKPTIKQ